MAELGTIIPIPSIEQSSSILTGFDRESSDVGGKLNGIIQYCHSASSGEVHNIASDANGVYTLLTSQTQFADGTALADRTLMMYHDSTESLFSYWRHGILNEVTEAKFIQLDVGFKGYVGFNSEGELDDSVTDVRELIVRTPLVAYLYLNSTKGTLEWLGDERHGIVMDGQTHLQQHNSAGFFIAGGLDITGLVNNGSTFTSISAGSAGDEDVKMAFSTTTAIPKLYKEGALGEWTHTDTDNNLGVFVTGQCCYNLDTAGTWSLEPIGSDYVTMMPMCSHNKLYPVAMLVGQKLHASRTVARDRSPSEYYRVKVDGLPSHEFHPLSSIIIHNESTGQIEIGTDDEIYFDYRHDFPLPIFD